MFPVVVVSLVSLAAVLLLARRAPVLPADTSRLDTLDGIAPTTWTPDPAAPALPATTFRDVWSGHPDTDKAWRDHR